MKCYMLILFEKVSQRNSTIIFFNSFGHELQSSRNARYREIYLYLGRIRQLPDQLKSGKRMEYFRYDYFPLGCLIVF